MNFLGTALILLILLLPALAESSVIQVSLDEMAHSSELIFQGRVLSKRAEWDPRGTTIHTYVTFQIQEVIKGAHTGSQIVLRYQGGTIGTLTLNVSDVVPPDVGETGIYFVSSPARAFVHPLYGWDQGHFLVIRDAGGIDRVFTRNLKPVIAIQPTQGKQAGLSSGVAAGLLLAEQSRRSDAMRVADFRQRVRGIVAAQ
jgi:hypothetical protein